MLRGSLYGQNLGDSIRLYFLQRGDSDENRNVPVKIYRRVAPDVNFSNDLSGMDFDKWYEYVDNQSHFDERVKIIFEGTLPLEQSFNEYIDKDVETGKIYIYWVKADSMCENTILGPLGVKVRSRDVWWPYSYAVEEMKKLELEFQNYVKVLQYGKTTMHKPIMGMQVGNQAKVIAIVGAIHASETGHELILKTIRYILEKNHQILNRIGFAVIPSVNIDVRERTVDGVPHYLRLNNNGVDLNRNFDYKWGEQFTYGMSNSFYRSLTYHGPYPNSENETKTLINFIDSSKPIALFVFDSGSVITEDRLLTQCCVDDGELYDYTNKIATLYSKVFRSDIEGCGTFTAPPIKFPFDEPIFEKTGKPGGTFEGWVYDKYKIPAYSMQYARSKEGKIRLNDDTTADLLQKWSIRHAHALLAVLNELAKQ